MTQDIDELIKELQEIEKREAATRTGRVLCETIQALKELDNRMEELENTNIIATDACDRFKIEISDLQQQLKTANERVEKWEEDFNALARERTHLKVCLERKSSYAKELQQENERLRAVVDAAKAWSEEPFTMNQQAIELLLSVKALEEAAKPEETKFTLGSETEGDTYAFHVEVEEDV